MLDDEVRQSVQDADSLICLVTRNSLESQWVWLELGARWYLQKPLTPLYACGTVPDDLGPLLKFIAVDCSREDPLNDLIDRLAKKFGIQPNPVSYYGRKLRDFVAASAPPQAQAQSPTLGPSTSPPSPANNPTTLTPTPEAQEPEVLARAIAGREERAIIAALASEQHVRSDYWVNIANIGPEIEAFLGLVIQRFAITTFLDDLETTGYLERDSTGRVKLKRKGFDLARMLGPDRFPIRS